MALGTGYYPENALKVQTGNAVSPWQTEAERRAANNAWLAPYGLSADVSKPIDPYSRTGSSALGMDGMGGVFNPDGYSSNPNFLQGNIGVSRNQLAARGWKTYRTRRFKARIRSTTPETEGFANDLWVDPKSGVISSVKGDGYVSVGDIRNTLSGMTGQQYADSWGFAAPFVSPGYYDGKSNNTADMAARQQELIAKIIQSSATPPAAAAPGTTVPGTTAPETTTPDIVPGVPNPLDELRIKWLQEELARYQTGLAAIQ